MFVLIDPPNRPINSPIVHFNISGCRPDGFVVYYYMVKPGTNPVGSAFGSIPR